MRIRTVECDKCEGTGKIPAGDTGLQLRDTREKAGVSLRGLSAALGLSPSYVADLELGRRNLNNGLVELYTEALSKLTKDA